MSDVYDLRMTGSGLHPSHFAAMRTEVLRTGAELSDEQLLDLTDALQRVIRLRRPDRPIRRPDAWIDGEPPAFA